MPLPDAEIEGAVQRALCNRLPFLMTDAPLGMRGWNRRNQGIEHNCAAVPGCEPQGPQAHRHLMGKGAVILIKSERFRGISRCRASHRPRAGRQSQIRVREEGICLHQRSRGRWVPSSLGR